MIRIVIACVIACVILAVALVAQIRTNARLADALDEARAYIETRKETDDALSDLPDDPDAVLRELCRIAPGGSGCVDP